MIDSLVNSLLIMKARAPTGGLCLGSFPYHLWIASSLANHKHYALRRVRWVCRSWNIHKGAGVGMRTESCRFSLEVQETHIVKTDWFLLVVFVTC